MTPELFATYETIELTFDDGYGYTGRAVFRNATFTSLRPTASVITHDGYTVYEGEGATHMEDEGGAAAGLDMVDVYRVTGLGTKLVEGIDAMAKATA